MNIQAPNANSNNSPDISVWYLLAQFSLGDFLSDRNRNDDLLAGFLFSPTQESGTLPKWVANIEVTLARFAEEVRGQFEQGGRDLPGEIRIFCQKKIIEVVNSTKTAKPGHTEPAMNRDQAYSDSGGNMLGGWGYFFVERSADSSTSHSVNPHHFIDLYIYKEGG